MARMLLSLGDVTYSLETHSVHSNSIYSKILHLGKVASGYNIETVWGKNERATQPKS